MTKAYGVACEIVGMCRGAIPFALACAGADDQEGLVNIGIYTGENCQLVELTVPPESARALAGQILDAAAIAKQDAEEPA